MRQPIKAKNVMRKGAFESALRDVNRCELVRQVDLGGARLPADHKLVLDRTIIRELEYANNTPVRVDEKGRYVFPERWCETPGRTKHPRKAVSMTLTKRQGVLFEPVRDTLERMMAGRETSCAVGLYLADRAREVFVVNLLVRIVHRLLADKVLSVIDERLPPLLFSYRPQRGVNTALFAVRQSLRRGFVYAASADIQGFFRNVRLPLAKRVLDAVPVFDDSMREALLSSMCHPVVRDVSHPLVVSGAFSTVEGPLLSLYPGSSLAPLLSNLVGEFVLRDFRRRVGEDVVLLRYADDMLLLGRSAAATAHGLVVLHELLDREGLALHPNKTDSVARDVRLAGAPPKLWLGAEIGASGVRLPDAKLERQTSKIVSATVGSDEHRNASACLAHSLMLGPSERAYDAVSDVDARGDFPHVSAFERSLVGAYEGRNEKLSRMESHITRLPRHTLFAA